VRPQDKGEPIEATCSELQEPLASSSNHPIEEIVPTEVEVSRNGEAEAAKIDEIASTVKRETKTKASTVSRSGYLSDIWTKATSFAWKRKVTDVESWMIQRTVRRMKSRESSMPQLRKKVKSP